MHALTFLTQVLIVIFSMLLFFSISSGLQTEAEQLQSSKSSYDPLDYRNQTGNNALVKTSSNPNTILSDNEQFTAPTCVDHDTTSVQSVLEAFLADNRHLSFSSKCFSCEREFPEGYKWMGQATKCFSCEKAAALMNTSDPAAPMYTHQNKCLSCER